MRTKLFASVLMVIGMVMVSGLQAKAAAAPILKINMSWKMCDAETCTKLGGICDVTFDIEIGLQANPGDNIAVGDAIVTTGGNLQVDFQKNSMHANLYNTLFSNGSFRMPADYNLPSAACKKLGVSSYTIKRGTYAYTEANGIIRVIF